MLLDIVVEVVLEEDDVDGVSVATDEEELREVVEVVNAELEVESVEEAATFW